jgi:hypothetical protein
VSSASPPEPYSVDYSGRVRQRLRALTKLARERGDAEAFVAALREFDRRLRVYPQFGEQLTDLKHEPGQMWIGSVPPLTMRYAVFDERRMVVVAAIPILMPQAKQ